MLTEESYYLCGGFSSQNLSKFQFSVYYQLVFCLFVLFYFFNKYIFMKPTLNFLELSKCKST